MKEGRKGGLERGLKVDLISNKAKGLTVSEILPVGPFII